MVWLRRSAESKREGSALIVAADGSGHCHTIAEAVAAARLGGEILVRPGTYAERLVLKRTVMLRGAGEPGSIVLVRPHGQPAIRVESPDVLLEGVVIVELEAADDTQGGAATSEADDDEKDVPKAAIRVAGVSGSATIRDVEIRGGSHDGIAVHEQGQARIERCAIYGVQGTGVSFLEGASGHVDGTRIEGSGVSGIQCRGRGTNVGVRGSTISQSRLFGIAVFDRATVALEGSRITGGSDGCWVSDRATFGASANEIDGIDGMAIRVQQRASADLRGNRISFPGSAGIGVSGTGTFAEIRENVIFGSGSGSIAVVEGAVAEITGNAIVSSQSVGLHVTGDATSVRASGNAIRRCRHAAAALFDGCSLQLASNELTGNGFDGALVDRARRDTGEMPTQVVPRETSD